MHNMINAQIYLQDAVDSREPDTLLDQIVLSLMYHPRFPDTFFNFIANSVDGIPILQTEDVEPFLEGNYSNTLKQPDCEYLSSILKLWSNRYTVLRYTNLNKALAWIERKSQLLPEWPANSSDSFGSIVDVTNLNSQQSKHQIAAGLPPSEIKLLTEVLKGVDLLGDNGKFRATVQSGQVAGVIRYLIKNRNFTSECTSIFNAIKFKFGPKCSLSSIQHYMTKSQRNINYYDKTRRYFEEIDHER